MSESTATGADVQAAIRESVAAMLAGTDQDADGFDQTRWEHLARAGFTRLTWPEDGGGAGAGPDLAAAVLVEAGAQAARIPLVEADLATGWLLARTGLRLAETAGPVAAVAADLLEVAARGADVSVRARLRAVPGASTLTAVVAVGDGMVVVLDPIQADVRPGRNLADEDRDELTFDTVVAASQVAEVADTDFVGELRMRSALGRALLLSGALRTALDVATEYAGTRVQFGRPIGAFQAVQQALAASAGEVAAAGSAAGAAANLAARDGFEAGSTQLAIGAAKAHTSEAAGAVAATAHQVLGAIGFTREHRLRRLTTRLWAWRDEDGSEAYWQRVVGHRLISGGPSQLWPALTID